jgi:hypothetical protein
MRGALKAPASSARGGPHRHDGGCFFEALVISALVVKTNCKSTLWLLLQRHYEAAIRRIHQMNLGLYTAALTNVRFWRQSVQGADLSVCPLADLRRTSRLPSWRNKWVRLN